MYEMLNNATKTGCVTKGKSPTNIMMCMYMYTSFYMCQIYTQQAQKSFIKKISRKTFFPILT